MIYLDIWLVISVIFFVASLARSKDDAVHFPLWMLFALSLIWPVYVVKWLIDKFFHNKE